MSGVRVVFTSSPVVNDSTPFVAVLEAESDKRLSMTVRGIGVDGSMTQATVLMTDEVVIQLSIAFNAEMAKRYRVKPFSTTRKT